MYGAPIYVLYTFVPVDPYIWMENDVVVVVVLLLLLMMMMLMLICMYCIHLYL